MSARGILLKGAVLAAGVLAAGVSVAPVAAAQAQDDPAPATQYAQDLPAQAGKAAAPQVAAAPVPVTALTCDGDTGKCTAKLQFGDGRWVAQWPAAILHQ